MTEDNFIRWVKLVSALRRKCRDNGDFEGAEYYNSLCRFLYRIGVDLYGKDI